MRKTGTSNRTNQKYQTAYNRGGTQAGRNYSATKGRKTNTTTNVPKGYNNVHCTLENKYRSFRTLWDQTRGPAKTSRPSPTTLQSFSNWINKGAFISKVTPNQINKWCGTKQKFNTCAQAKNTLCNFIGLIR